MLIAKLSISYDRGLSINKEEDLGLTERKREQKTADGKVIRGLGTHYRSEFDQQLVKERDLEANRVRAEFRANFIVTPIDGTFFVPTKGAARKLLQNLQVRSDVNARVSEFRLESPDGLDGSEVSEWAGRIKRQLGTIQLGRKKQLDDEGLDALVALSKCPVLKDKTAKRIRELVELVRAQKIDRVELRRGLDTLTVEVEPEVLSPRRIVPLKPEGQAVAA